MKALSVIVSHYPNISERKKPLTPVAHSTIDHAYMDVKVTKPNGTHKIYVVHGLSPATIAYKTRITLLYIATYLNNKRAKPLSENILYQDIVDWFNAQTFS